MGCLKIFKGIISSIFSLILFIAITIGIPLSSALKLLQNRENTKNYLSNSSFYSLIQTEITYEIVEDSKKSINLNSFFTDDELYNATKNIVTKDYVQTIIEDLIDSIYDILEGKKDTLDLKIDTNSKREEVLRNISALIYEKAIKFDVCPSNSFSIEKIFVNNCRIANLKEEDIYDALSKSTKLNEIQSIEKIILNFEGINNAKVQLETFLIKQMRFIYKIVSMLSTTILIVIAVLSALIFLLNSGIKNKIFSIGIIWLLSSGILLFGWDSYFNQASDYLAKNYKIKVSNDREIQLQDLIKPSLDLLFKDAKKDSRDMLIIIAVLGSVFIISSIIIFFTERAGTKEKKQNSEEIIQKEKIQNFPLPPQKDEAGLMEKLSSSPYRNDSQQQMPKQQNQVQNFQQSQMQTTTNDTLPKNNQTNISINEFNNLKMNSNEIEKNDEKIEPLIVNTEPQKVIPRNKFKKTFIEKNNDEFQSNSDDVIKFNQKSKKDPPISLTQ